MTAYKRIGIGLIGPRKTRHTAEFPQLGESLHTTREDLMYVGLMAYVKDNSVFKGVKDFMQCHRQLHRTQIGRQMAAGFGNTFNQEAANILTKGSILLRSKRQKLLPIPRTFQ